MTTENTNQENAHPTIDEVQAELERLRTHNAQLLADIKAERKAHKETQSALLAAKGGEDGAWKARYYQAAVINPLMNELKSLSPFPVKYMQDVCMEMGLLKMQEDSEGLMQPHWYDPNGEAADLSSGLYKFLARVCDELPDSELPKTLRSSGMSGGGATGGWAPIQREVKQEKPEDKSKPVAYGLK